MNKTSVARLRARLLMAICASLVAACASNAAPIQTPTDVAVTPTTAAVVTPSLAPVATSEPPPVTASPEPTPVPTPTPLIVWLPPGSPLPPTTLPGGPVPPTTLPGPTEPPPTQEPPTDGLISVASGNVRATRVFVPALGIDLPVMPGNTAYPYCNVAQYLSNFVFPGQQGTTYMYGHARTGMFLPFLTRSKINDGASMIGMKVFLYTADKKLHLYRINIVKRHTRDFSLAYDLQPGEHRLIMQTSEGPNGTYPKLQIAAQPIGVYEASAADALPTPHPKVCG